MPDATLTAAAERFQHDTATHKMTVLRDDGLYRHLRFRRVVPSPKTGKPEFTSMYWFDLITWPGCLTVNGDCGTFTFTRTDDMFEFFRRNGNDHGINPGYWAEKAQAVNRDGGLSRYSQERFRQHVVDYVTEAIRDGYAPRGIGRAVREEIFGEYAKWNTELEDDARRALEDFAFGDTWTVECKCRERAEGLAEGDAFRWERQGHIGADHRVDIKRVEGFRFYDTWEWDLSDYDWQYLWCCHAIVWGIAQYNQRPRRGWLRQIAAALARKC